MRGVSIGRSVNARSIAPGAVVTTGDGNTIEPSPRVQGFQQGSMRATQTPAYQARTQPASANQQQSEFSQRQTTAPVNQPETLSQRFGNVFKNAAGYGLVAVAASGGALLAPVAVAAVAVIAAYKAIQALEAVMNLFKRDNKPQGQQQAPSGQQQQQQPTGQQVGQRQDPQAQQQQQPAGDRADLYSFMGDAYLASLEKSIRETNRRSSQRIQEEEAAARSEQEDRLGAINTNGSTSSSQNLNQERQQPAPASQGEQQPAYQQLAIPGLVTTGNPNGGVTGIQFTQDVNLGSVGAPSAPGFNMDTVAQALAAARGSR